MKIVIFSDHQRGSYRIVSGLYRKAFERMGHTVEEVITPVTFENRATAYKRYSGWLTLHITLGNGFVPLPKAAANIAVPFHEWSRYPTQWISLLNKFDQIWTLSSHIYELLKDSGATTPIHFCPPPLDMENIPPKRNWKRNSPFRFLFCGEPHFRKGHHLLMQGFVKAFPKNGTAELTIKTSADCVWESMREDIHLIKSKMERVNILEMYAQHDCYVSASLGEGFGLPVAEAILAGLPVAANYWGGHKSLLVENGFFRIAHEEVDQPFCSLPEYYADGQKCALSRPNHVAESLRHVYESNANVRYETAERLRRVFIDCYGSEAFISRINPLLVSLQDQTKLLKT